MQIETLKLKNFRNYKELMLNPHPGVNLFFGRNGTGKTNLLEAVHYCSLGRSHRISNDANVVKNGKGAKVRVYKMKPKKGYRRTQGHRQPYTKVQIEAINA